MAAPIFLEPYRMKKKAARKHPIREREIPVTMQFMREFRAEIMSVLSDHTAQFKKIDARFAQVDAQFAQVHARFEQMDAKTESKFQETKADIHAVKVLCEEQNLRNKQAYDGYFWICEKVLQLESRIKPECLNEV